MLRLLQLRGLSQHQIADESGISQTVISRIVCGEQRNVSYEQGKSLERVVERWQSAPVVKSTERRKWGAGDAS